MAEKGLFIGVKHANGHISNLTPAKTKSKGGDFYMQNRPVALDLALDPELSKLDYKVFLFLLGNMEYNNDVIVSQKGLAEALCVQYSAVSKSVGNLIAKNMISKREANGVKRFHIEEAFAVRTRKMIPDKKDIADGK